MPLYEYECTECGMVEETLQKFSDAPLTSCRSCQGKLRKLVSHSSFHLKGSGWYVTDYASKSGAPSSSPAPKTTETKTEKSAEKTTEKKSSSD
ncbi:MAG: zinc ribbon domain-containing protein [Proteobacteria bacterium]|nr:zinc ribbon domain-containing protein [Pseudomonadota bacterium]